MTKRQKGEKTKRQKYKKTKRQNKYKKSKRQKYKKTKRQKDKSQRPKREFIIVTSGQFRTLAMFFINIHQCIQFEKFGYILIAKQSTLAGVS